MGVCATKSNVPIAVATHEPDYDLVARRLHSVLIKAMSAKSAEMHGNYWIDQQIVKCAESLLSYDDGYELVSQVMADFESVDLHRSLLLAALLD